MCAHDGKIHFFFFGVCLCGKLSVRCCNVFRSDACARGAEPSNEGKEYKEREEEKRKEQNLKTRISYMNFAPFPAPLPSPSPPAPSEYASH